jgi:hypothetical protein
MKSQLESLCTSGAATCSRSSRGGGQGPPWTWEDTKTLKKMAGKHHPQEIADALGRTLPAVKGKARKLSLCLIVYGEKHTSARYSNHEVERCRRLHEQGWGPSKISKTYGYGIHTVKAWIYFAVRTNDPIRLQ